MDQRTGKRLTHGRVNIHLVATLLKGQEGVWRVSTLEQVGDACTPTT